MEQRSTPDIWHGLILCLFAVVVPSVLLAVLTGSTALDLQWHSPLLQFFLLSSSAALAAVVGFWLDVETRRSGHPAILVLSFGFYGLSLILAVAAWLREPLHLGWFVILYGAWIVVFSGTAALLIGWRRARRFLMLPVVKRPVFSRLCAAGCFFLCMTLALVYCRVFLQDAGTVTRVAPSRAVPALAAMVATLLFLFRLFFTRHTLVILAFAIGLVLFGLEITALTLSPTWHPLWWYGHTLGFAALFMAALGIMEGNRTRAREILISELGALSRKLEEQSIRDPLTGCYNRRFALEVLDNEFRKSRRAKLPLALLIADADNFKAINDTHGHPMGDFVLKELVTRLKEVMRTSDVLARCGGEEFYLVLPLSNRMGGQSLAEKLLTAIRGRPFERGPVSLRVTVSMGIADTLTPGVTDVATLIEAADRALYSAKAAGKDRAVTLEPLAFSTPQ